MFVLKDAYTVDREVTIELETPEGVQRGSFTARFEILRQSEIDEHYEKGGDDGGLLRRVLVGWGDDLRDLAGAPIPFDEAARDALIGWPFVRLALAVAYREAAQGIKRKNFATPPADGSRAPQAAAKTTTPPSGSARS